MAANLDNDRLPADFPSPPSWADRLHPENLTIFLFHGVVEQSDYLVRNYNRKHLAAADFRAIMTALSERGSALSMDEVIAHHKNQTPYPEYAFAVTFDDSFENNLTVAAPILRELGIPATLYATTGFISNNRMSWVDRIEWAFEEKCRFDKAVEPDLPWQDTPVRAETAEEMRALLSDIRTKVKSGLISDPDAFATEIQVQLGLSETWTTPDPLDKKLTWDQIRELHDDPLFIIGGHSHSHAILSYLDESALANELDTSLRLLKDNTGIDPVHYAYPEGLPDTFSQGVIEALKDRGIVCCPTAISGYNTPETDLFHLKRFLVM
ncbi:MAG: polysaccharide deacetylase family protein [Rhodospirillales bacterium]|nr:polysaccharide deacetylase family protein [Rhodospirillales bacterium]MBO6785918.1 polysaccharide deacetylase family protein [Rhodospirillales bacterium]